MKNNGMRGGVAAKQALSTKIAPLSDALFTSALLSGWQRTSMIGELRFCEPLGERRLYPISTVSGSPISRDAAETSAS